MMKLDEVRLRLAALSRLLNGWLDGDGLAIDKKLLLIANDLIKILYLDFNVRTPYIYPTVCGGISLEWTLPKAEVTVEFYPHKSHALLDCLSMKSCLFDEGICLDLSNVQMASKVVAEKLSTYR